MEGEWSLNHTPRLWLEWVDRQMRRSAAKHGESMNPEKTGWCSSQNDARKPTFSALDGKTILMVKRLHWNQSAKHSNILTSSFCCICAHPPPPNWGMAPWADWLVREGLCHPKEGTVAQWTAFSVWVNTSGCVLEERRGEKTPCRSETNPKTLS